MIQKTIEKNRISFIAANSLTAEEIKEINDKFSVNTFIQNELLRPTLQPKIIFFKDAVYLVLHFPIFDKNKDISKRQEIDFVIGKNFILAANYNHDFPPLQEFIDRIQKEDHAHYFNGNVGVLFSHLIQHFYKFSLRQLDYMQKKIDYIEEQIFLKKEKEMVERISVVSRDIIEFRRAIKPHQRILNSFHSNIEEFFGKESKEYFSEVLNEYFNLRNLFEGTAETINSLQETNDSLVSIKANDEMRIISIVAFITFPLMLFSSVFGMNTEATPIVGTKNDFWIIIGIMILGVSIMFYIFKKKRWI